VAGSRRNSGAPHRQALRPGSVRAAQGTGLSTSGIEATVGQVRKLPSVRLAPRDELAASARVAPLLRAARDMQRWAAGRPEFSSERDLSATSAAVAASALDLQPREVLAAWRVALAIRLRAGQGPGGAAPELTAPPGLTDVLASGDTESVLVVWDAALAAVLDSEELDGIATALYTVGGPVGMDGLFDAYAGAAGTRRDGGLPGAGSGSGRHPETLDSGAALSQALETLADLGVVELGTEEADGSLTVALSPLGTWGVHRRLRAQGWHVPVLGAVGRDGAAGLLAALASCDAEDGEAEIETWLSAREPAVAAAELIDAAATGSPGQRGAAFAVLDRIGASATAEVRAALDRALLRAHATVWLLEHGEDVPLAPEDRTWLLVDLGAGLLEEANPPDVVAELLPDLPAKDQAEIVAGLWRVDHPGVTSLLTALSDHHPDPGVARAARKAAFKARSPAATDRPMS
jgi:hypothetical protein